MNKVIILSLMLVYSSTLMCQVVTKGPNGIFYEGKKSKAVQYDSSCFVMSDSNGNHYNVYIDRRRRKYYYFVRVNGSLYKKYLIQ